MATSKASKLVKKAAKAVKDAKKRPYTRKPKTSETAAATPRVEPPALESEAAAVHSEAPSLAAIEVKHLDDQDTLARELLGDQAVVWTASEDSKGNKFPSPLFRVGVHTDKPNSSLVEDGKLMIGTGRTFAEAFRDARKRTEAASAPAA